MRSKGERFKRYQRLPKFRFAAAILYESHLTNHTDALAVVRCAQRARAAHLFVKALMLMPVCQGHMSFRSVSVSRPPQGCLGVVPQLDFQVRCILVCHPKAVDLRQRLPSLRESLRVAGASKNRRNPILFTLMGRLALLTPPRLGPRSYEAISHDVGGPEPAPSDAMQQVQGHHGHLLTPLCHLDQGSVMGYCFCADPCDD